MCPACIASAGWMVGGAMSTGGLTALVVKVFHKKHSKGDSQQRSNDYANSNEAKK